MAKPKREYTYNYFYKITNNINGHFYYGIHSTDDLSDGYMGSGSRLNRAYKKYGIENFTKEILEYFDTREEVAEYEAEMVTEELVQNDDCYNISLGGEKMNTVGFISVIVLSTNEKMMIKSEEYLKNKHLYKTFCSDKITVKDKQGNFYHIDINDERLLTRELVPIWTGKHHSEETKQKQKDTFKKTKHQLGETNSQYGTCWIKKPNNTETKKINKDELDYYLSKGWIKGRFIKDKSKMHGNNKGIFGKICWVVKQGESPKQIKIEDLQKYIDDGYKRGMKI